MLLDYFALAVLIVGALLVFYTFVYIHDLPHKLAKKRGHPHSEAIGIACWLSLLTLHVIWPIVFIWAMTKQNTALIASGDESQSRGEEHTDASSQIDVKLREIELRLKKLEQGN